MSARIKQTRIIRWLLSVAMVVAGLSLTWAWGQVSRLAEPVAVEPAPQPSALYAVWQPDRADHNLLFRSSDGGTSWQPLVLPESAAPIIWVSDGGDRLALAMDDGALLVSQDQGDSWTVAAEQLPILSMAWGEAGDLYLGTDRQGIQSLATDGTLTTINGAPEELATSPVLDLAVVDGRLFAAIPGGLFFTDADPVSPDLDTSWLESSPVPGGLLKVAAIERETVFAGTETSGVYRSTDAGATWHPASAGLGLAAGQMVQITALHVDPQEAGVLYATVNHVLGSTHVYASAAGTFATVDGGASWQPLAGPTFPDARHASALILVAGKPLYAQAVTADGLRSYEPDVAGALAALEIADGQTRAAAARTLGLAQSQEATEALLAALDDPDPAVGLAVAEALGRIADPATANALLVALEHPEEQVRLNAVRALGALGSDAATEPLRTLLLNDRGAAVSVAADSLRRIGGPAATEALLAALSAPSDTPRWHAAMTALETMGESAVEPLIRMLDSKDAHVRHNAAEALGWIGSPLASAALVDALEDPSYQVRAQSAWALGEIGDPAARVALARVQSRDPSAVVQVAAEAALNQIGDLPVTVTHWPETWAPTLKRLQAVRWSFLALSFAGAIWLVAGQRSLPLLAMLQVNRRQ